MAKKPTQRFQSKTTFGNWLRRMNYTKDASPGTGIYNSKGKRIGATFEKEGKGNKRMVEVDFY